MRETTHSSVCREVSTAVCGRISMIIFEEWRGRIGKDYLHHQSTGCWISIHLVTPTQTMMEEGGVEEETAVKEENVEGVGVGVGMGKRWVQCQILSRRI